MKSSNIKYSPKTLEIVENIKRLTSELETEELESPEGVASIETYSQLLVVYMLQSDLSNAKLLWKRIPPSVKTANPELGKIWSIGQKLWQRDFPEIYKELDSNEWSDSLKNMMQSLKEIIRNRAVTIVSNAYSSVSLEDFAMFIGATAVEAPEAAEELGWKVDVASNMIYPVKPESAPIVVTPSDEQLAKLTEFVAFLEN